MENISLSEEKQFLYDVWKMLSNSSELELREIQERVGSLGSEFSGNWFRGLIQTFLNKIA